MVKIDKIDLKILKELLGNSRLTLSKIGKKVRLSRENVHYRIQRLIKEGIIRDFITDINFSKLGFSQYTIFLEFEKINHQKEKEIIDYLHKRESISWVGVLSGKWSLTFDVYVRDNKELGKILDDFLAKFKNNIGEYIVLNVSGSEYFFEKIIDQSVKHISNLSELKFKVDEKDIKILKSLNNNSRLSYVELADKIKLTPNAIKQRLKNLEKASVISGYSISINHKHFGYEWHGIQIKLGKQSSETESNLKKYLENHNRVIFYYQYSRTGIYDFDVGVMVKNSSELREFINDLRSKFYEEAKIYDTFLVLEEVSSQKLPGTIFKN